VEHFANLHSVPHGTFPCSRHESTLRAVASFRGVGLGWPTSDGGFLLVGAAGVELFGVLAGRKLFLAVLGFSTLQVCLTTVCSCCGIHSRLQVGLLEEVAPALVAVFRALARFQLSQCRLCVLPTLDYLDYTSGPVGPDVMANDDVGSTRFVACQRDSVGRLPGSDPRIPGAACPPFVFALQSW